MQIPILSQSLISQLYSDVEKNVFHYLNNTWKSELIKSARCLDDTKIPENFEEALIFEEGLREGQLDAINSKIVYESLNDLTPYQARDERILSAVSHIFASDYAIKRHKIEKSDNDKIKRHFFARGNGLRSIERDNVIGKLWWNGYFISRCREHHDFEELLNILCLDTDFRQNLVERPGSSVVPQVALAILLCKKSFQEQNPGSDFFTGRSNPKYREWFKNINLYGGTHLYATMSSKSLYELFWANMVSVNES